MREPCDLLFAYGTLLSGDAGTTGRSQRARLQGEARLIGEGWTAGRLYDLGRYPGLVLSAAPGEHVHGEVYALADPDRSLRWLDAYEGIVPGQHPHNAYERMMLAVTCGDGGVVTAWAYIYQRVEAGNALIGSGRWLVRS